MNIKTILFFSLIYCIAFSQNCESVIPDYRNDETTTINRSNLEGSTRSSNGEGAISYDDINSNSAGTGWNFGNSHLRHSPKIIRTPWKGNVVLPLDKGYLISKRITPDPYQSPLNLPVVYSDPTTGIMLGAGDDAQFYRNFHLNAGTYLLYFSQLNATEMNGNAIIASSRWSVTLSSSNYSETKKSKFMVASNFSIDNTSNWHRSFLKFEIPVGGEYRLEFKVENIDVARNLSTGTPGSRHDFKQENYLLIDNIEFYVEGDCKGPRQLTKKDHSSFKPTAGAYVVSAWVKETHNSLPLSYSSSVSVSFFTESGGTSSTTPIEFSPTGHIIEGWQRIEGFFNIPLGSTAINVVLHNKIQPSAVYFDDVRIHKSDGAMKSFVYDPVTQRLMAELDENNYATLYEYDKEGGLVRVKKETERGVYTIQETRSGNSKHTINKE